MARGKPRRKAGPAMFRGPKQKHYIHDDAAHAPLASRFTLQDEARATAHSSSGVGGQTKLRFATIKFISAGQLNKLDPVEQVNSDAYNGHLLLCNGTPTTLANRSRFHTESHPEETDKLVSLQAPGQNMNSVVFQDSLNESLQEASNEVITGTYGKSLPLERDIDHNVEPRNTGPAHATNAVRAPSPVLSDSSEEVIVFRGRDIREREEAIPILGSSAQIIEEALPVDARLAIVEHLLHHEHDKLDEIVERHDQSTHKQACLKSQPQRSTCLGKTLTKAGRGGPEDDIPEHNTRISVVHKATAVPRHEQCRSGWPMQSPGYLDSDFIGFTSIARKGRKSRDRNQKKRKQVEDELLLSDYLSNAREYNEIQDESDEGRANKEFVKRRLFDQSLAYSNQAESEASEDVPDDLVSYDEQGQDNWDASDLHDFDDISTSDGVMGNLEVILARRKRRGGLQYLVVWEDQPQDEARWVPLKTLIESGSQPHVEAFELEHILQSSHQMDRFASTSEESNVCEYDRKAARKSPQGMCCTKPQDNGSDVDICALRISDVDSNFNIREGEGLCRTSSNLATRGAEKHTRGTYPTATALADAYDYGYMEVPASIPQPNYKGRGKPPSFDIDDSELEVSMRATWENDRRKKTDKKKAREQLRARGLLQSKSAAPDLKQVYRNGITIQDVKKEIRIFLRTRASTLALPPMGKSERKIVHELANAFSLRSKSAGLGNARFPVLFRTSRTRHNYTESMLDDAEWVVSHRYKSDGTGHRLRKAVKARNAGKGNSVNSSNAASYRDGEIVGASAPELGIGNKGRAMLERMGWSAGLALGATNNKGILEPVSHVVKTTKAGLG